MRLNVQYIPLEKIKPNLSVRLSEHVKKLRSMMWDCMHMLVVKKDKEGEFTIICGNDRFEYLSKHTKYKYVPCIVDEHPKISDVKDWLNRSLYIKKRRRENNKICPASASIIRAFIKKDPRFKSLSHIQRVKVLFLAVRYKKTVITTMKSKVTNYLEKDIRLNRK